MMTSSGGFQSNFPPYGYMPNQKGYNGGAGSY